MVVGRRASGSTPAWASSVSRRGDADASTSFGRALGFLEASLASVRRSDCRCGKATLLKAVSNPAFCEVIRRHLDLDLVPGQPAAPVLSHTAGGVRDDLVPALELYPERRIRQ